MNETTHEHGIFTMTRKRRFTLVELLVVIAIIAILSSIMLPAVSKAKKKGQSITCMSNLRQMGLMMNYYQSDYNEYYQWFIFNTNASVAGSPLYSWIAYLASYNNKFKGIETVAASYPISVNTNFNEAKKKFQMFTCPAAQWLWLDPIELGGNRTAAGHQSYATNYTANFSMMGMNYSAAARNSIRISQITKPSKTAPCWDGVRTPTADNSWYIKLISAGGNPAVDYRHNNSTNVLFSDGHTSAFPMMPILSISYRDVPLCLWR